MRVYASRESAAAASRRYQSTQVTRRGRGRFAPGSDGEKAVKIKIQQRVDHDFANRRIFERSRIIEEQGVTRRTGRERDADGLERSEARLERLDEDLEYLKDVERANEAVGKALQKQIVAFVQEAVEANKVRDAASSLSLTPSTRLVFISRWRGWFLC